MSIMFITSKEESTRLSWFRPLLATITAAAVAVLLPACSSVSKSELVLIADATAVTSGTTVADVGAGSGDLVPHLANWVGVDGQVFATELDGKDVTALTELATKLELNQVIALQGSPTSTGLPPECCDAIVMRMVYHHFTDPEPFIESLHAALRPGGRLLVVDFQPSFWMGSSTPSDLPEDRQGQHGIVPATVVKEVTAKGFSLSQQHTDWPGPGSILLNHFGLVFVRE